MSQPPKIWRQRFRFEKEAEKRGYKRIAGVDEAGRGPLAGPVVAAACVLPAGVFFPDIDDSKKLSPERRKESYRRLVEHSAVLYAVGVVEADIVDRINILQATFHAMCLAVVGLARTPDYVLVDGPQLPNFGIPAEGIIGGDGLSNSIAAASIIAKETRDRLMLEYHDKWPQYGFDQHKGYGTKAHLLAIEKEGPCPIHRMTFEPLRGYA